MSKTSTSQQKNKITPWIALAGLDHSIIETAKEIGLGKYLHRIERFGVLKFTQTKIDQISIAQNVIKTNQSVTVKVGPNNIHDILDSLKH